VVYGLLIGATLFNGVISYVAIVRSPRRTEAIREGLLRRDVREYRPVWWNAEMNAFADGRAAIVQSGEAAVTPIDDTGVTQSYQVSATRLSVITVKPLYFPGWVARLDEVETGMTPSADGNIQVSVPAGEHTLSLSFEDTWPRAAGKWLSILSVLVLLLGLLTGRLRGLSVRRAG
jgi:hypothetical protein